MLDARVFLKNTYGYSSWAEIQDGYESGKNRSTTTVEEYMAAIDYLRPVYNHYQLKGRILDCGGGGGVVREFLPPDIEYVSIDPWLMAPFSSSAARKEAYGCLNQPLNFIAATAEFLPFLAESFDWVHMQSMLDHVHVPDLVLLEAHRVLRQGGCILVGNSVVGGKSGVTPFSRRVKRLIKTRFGALGIDRWKDHHVWHPTYKALLKLITDNGFDVQDTYWQPHQNDTVCYVCALKIE